MTTFTTIYDAESDAKISTITGRLVEPIKPFHVQGGDDALSPCCIQPSNLVRRAGPRPDVAMKQCKVCKRRHFRGIAEPGVLRSRR